MKEIDSRWCDVGNRTVFKLNVFEDTDKGLSGELYKVENAYMTQCVDSNSCPALKSGASEEITGSDIEQIAEKAKARIQALGYEFSQWRKENG